MDVNSAHMKKAEAKQRQLKRGTAGNGASFRAALALSEVHSAKPAWVKTSLYISFDWRETKTTLSEVCYQTLLQIEGSGFKRFPINFFLVCTEKVFFRKRSNRQRGHGQRAETVWNWCQFGEWRSEFILSVPAPVCFCSLDFKASLKHFRSSHRCLFCFLFLLFLHIFFFFLSQSQPEEMCLPWSSRKNIMAKWPSPKTRSGVCIDCIDKHNLQFWCSGPDNVSNALYLF